MQYVKQSTMVNILTLLFVMIQDCISRELSLESEKQPGLNIRTPME